MNERPELISLDLGATVRFQGDQRSSHPQQQMAKSLLARSNRFESMEEGGVYDPDLSIKRIGSAGRQTL